MAEHERVVRQFYRSLALWSVVRRVVAAVTLWSFLWGTAALVLRVTQGTPAELLLWGAVGIPLAAVLAARVALRRLPGRDVVRAVLDRHGGCGGLLMAAAERDLGGWGDRVPAATVPAIRWRGGRPLGLLAVAVGYVALGFLLPVHPPALAGDAPLAIDREVDRLAEQVRVLKEEKVVEPKRADDLQQKLDDLRAQAAGKDPAKTLEALDHLNDVVRQAAKQAAESAARQVNKLGQLEAAADAVAAAAPQLDPKAAADLMRELSAMTKDAAAEGDRMREQLAELADGDLTPGKLPKLSASAKAGKEGLKQSARKMAKSRLIDPDQLKECEGGGKCDSEGLAQYLKATGGKKGLKEGMGDGPGRGGVTEGPGAAPLGFGDKTAEEGLKFREEALPASEAADLAQSQVVGVGAATPERDPKAARPATGALKGAAAGGGSANAAPVLPQHRGAVGRYFERPGK